MSNLRINQKFDFWLVSVKHSKTIISYYLEKQMQFSSKKSCDSTFEKIFWCILLKLNDAHSMCLIAIWYTWNCSMLIFRVDVRFFEIQDYNSKMDPFFKYLASNPETFLVWSRLWNPSYILFNQLNY